MDNDDGKASPEQFTRPSLDGFDGERPWIGTYTLPAPYRVFRLIQGGAKPTGPSLAVMADGFGCLSIGGQKAPNLRVVGSASDESSAHTDPAGPRF